MGFYAQFYGSSKKRINTPAKISLIQPTGELRECVCWLNAYQSAMHTAPQYFSVTKYVYVPFVMTSKSIPVVVCYIHCLQLDSSFVFTCWYSAFVNWVGVNQIQNTFNVCSIRNYRFPCVCISIRIL